MNQYKAVVRGPSPHPPGGTLKLKVGPLLDENGVRTGACWSVTRELQLGGEALVAHGTTKAMAPDTSAKWVAYAQTRLPRTIAASGVSINWPKDESQYRPLPSGGFVLTIEPPSPL